MKTFRIFENGEYVNTIIADDDFVQASFSEYEEIDDTLKYFNVSDNTLIKLPAIEGHSAGLTEASAEQINSRKAREHRDNELLNTDWIVPLTDHPQHTEYLTYRQQLRDWPTTDGFPDLRTIPSKP